MKLYPADIHSYRAKPDYDDEGGRSNCCGSCDECGELFEEGEPKIVFNDHTMHKNCAEEVRDKLNAEIGKW